VVGFFVIDLHAGLGIAKGVDIVGGVLVTAAALLAVTGFVEAGTDGWGSTTTLASLVGSVVAAGLFFLYESRHRNPLIPLRVLRSRNLVCAGISRAMFCFGSYGSFFLLVLYLQQVLGYGPLGNGLAFLPNSVLLSVMALTLAPHFMARITARVTHVIGLIGFAGGIALLIGIPVDGTFVGNVLPAMCVLGLSGGMFTVPNVTLAMAQTPADDSGLVSGVINVSQQIGAAMGVAVLASVSSIHTHALESSGVGHLTAVVDGFHFGFMVAVASLVVAIVAGLLVRSVPATVTSAETEAALQITEIEAL
jgi:hypothetical protein